MKQLLFMRELEAGDTKAIGRLERQLFPKKILDGWRVFQRDFCEAERDDCNISMGLFDRNRLVGYIVAYAVGTGKTNKPEDEEIVFIGDLAILPRYRQYAYFVFIRFFSELKKFYPRHPLEAYSFKSYLDKWVKHKRLFQHFGYRLTRYEKCEETSYSDDIYWVRWEPVHTQPQTEKKAYSEVITTSASYTVGEHVYTVELIRSEDGWMRLEPFWNSLLQQTEDHTVFQTFEYQTLWWKHFGLSRGLFILAIKLEGELIGIAPLQTYPIKIWGKYYRALEFIGTRWEVDRPTFLFHPEHAKECLDVTLRFLRDRHYCWDVCLLYEQLPHSLTTTFLQKTFPNNGYLFGTTRDSVCPYLTFSLSWEAFLASKSQRFRKNLKAARRKLQALGCLEFHQYQQCPEVEEKLELYKKIEEKSWKRAERLGIGKNRTYFHFYQDLSRVFCRQNQFKLLFLTLDGTPIAGTIALIYEDKYYSLQIVHDRDFNECSPGTLLESLELKECFKNKYKEYDFLGGFLKNKLRWTSLVRQTIQLHVFRKDWRLRFFFLVYFVLKPKVKGLLQKWDLLGSVIKLESRFWDFWEKTSKGKFLPRNKKDPSNDL